MPGLTNIRGPKKTKTKKASTARSGALAATRRRLKEKKWRKNNVVTLPPFQVDYDPKTKKTYGRQAKK